MARARRENGPAPVETTLPRMVPTLSGWAVLLLGVVLVVAAINSGVNTLFLISGTLLGAVLASGVGAWRQVTGLAVRRRLPEGVHAGEPFSVELTLSSRRRRPAHAVMVEDLTASAGEPWEAFTPYVPGRASRTLIYSARVRRRGVVRFTGVRLSSVFPFGLVRAAVELAGGGDEELVVYPALGEVRPSFLQGQLGGVRERASLQPSRLGTTDIHGLREYRPGDNPKWIHWRTSARLGKPVVKEFDREEARRIHVVLDGWLRPDDPEGAERFELGVSFAATLAAGSTRATRMVGLSASGTEPIHLPPAAGLGQVRVVLEHLARLEPTPDAHPPVPDPERPVLRNTTVILVVSDPGRLRSVSPGVWQAPGGSVRIVDVSAPAFMELFVPPAPPGAGLPSPPAGADDPRQRSAEQWTADALL